MFRLTYCHLKDYHKALPCLEKACELNPQDESHQFNYQNALSYSQGISTVQQLQNASVIAPNPDFLRWILDTNLLSV